ncbi:MAG: membrane protein insertion efficiency factor YidD [Maricaulaceae bacterium]|nr:membrane protein insertion efficiency factor YidD [Maricaulaceae bacterium]
MTNAGKPDSRSPAAWLALGLLAAYRYTLSPVFYAFGVRCRHEPTCSAYAADAVKAQGAWRGGWLAFGRVLRCRPGGTAGFDPAPQKRSKARFWQVWRFRERPAKVKADPRRIKDD